MAGIDMMARAATGWEALRDALHSRGIRSHEDFAEWIHAQGFPMPRWGAHFSARAPSLTPKLANGAALRDNLL